MKTILAVVLMMLGGSAMAQCPCVSPGTAPTVYNVTFSNGLTWKAYQPAIIPQGGNPCVWTGFTNNGGGVYVMHSSAVTGSPSGGVMLVDAVWVGFTDLLTGQNLIWRGTAAPSPRNGAGPFTINIGGGVTATVGP
jgi:hypothetical protein